VKLATEGPAKTFTSSRPCEASVTSFAHGINPLTVTGDIEGAGEANLS
jgi:hypothetical protein